MIVLILGSGPNAVTCQDWDRAPFDRIVAINNAWRVRPDWDDLIHPEDFPAINQPSELANGQRIVTAAEYVPLQNQMGGFVYAGGTMAFTAGYWALAALRPKVMAFLGCDMVYPVAGPTHFYGTGAPDPLRADISLRSLEAKSVRLMAMAAEQGCACVNLSTLDSRLMFPRATPDNLRDVALPDLDWDAAAQARATEARLGYMVPSGRYWDEADRFDPAQIDALDAQWLGALPQAAPLDQAVPAE